MKDIKKQDWKLIAKQIFLNLDDETIDMIHNEWLQLEQSFVELQKINVENLSPTDYCHNDSMNNLREDEPNLQQTNLINKTKYFIG